MSAIDQHQQLHAPRTAMIEERVESRADGAAGVEDVIHENDVLVIDIKADLHRIDHRLRTGSREIVAIEIDVKGPHLNWRLFNLGYQVSKPLCQGNSPPFYSDESQPLYAVIFFNDFMCETNQRSLDLRGRHETRFFTQRSE